MIINTIVSEILRIVLTFILSSAYFYLTELLLILIISPIILLIVTFSPSLPNKTKKFILSLNIFYSFLLLPIIYSLLLSVIRNYEIILNNMYMTSYFSIFSPILTEIYGNIGAFIVIYVIISIIMIILYRFNVIPNLKEYINNNKKILIEAILSFILGSFLIMIILTTNSESYIRLYFLIASLITAISQYILQFNRKDIKNIFNTLLSDDLVGLIIPWSFLLELIFLELKQSIEYIFTHFTWPYLISTCFIISMFILLLMVTINIYIEGINKNKEDIENIIECENRKNVKNIIKWIILSGYSSGFSFVYFSTNILILYLIGRTIISIILLIIFILYFIIFLYVYSRIHLKILESINKKSLGNVLGNILAAYALLSLAIYLIAEKLILVIAIVYTALPIILPLIAVKYINKNDNHDKNNSIPEK